MEEIRVMLQSPAFWFATLISGLIMSIIAGLLSHTVINVLAKFNTRIAKKKEKYKKKSLMKLQKISKNRML